MTTIISEFTIGQRVLYAGDVDDAGTIVGIKLDNLDRIIYTVCRDDQTEDEEDYYDGSLIPA